MDHKIGKPKITKPEQLLINGEAVYDLGKKVKVSDSGKSVNEVIEAHLRKRPWWNG